MSTIASPRKNASSIRALQYFEAVARHQSVKLAAEELGVSQSAVSHQLRELRKALGEELLVRSGRGIALSLKGRELAERLTHTFSSLQSSVQEIVGSGRQLLRIAVCSSFGPGWLIPRLHSFMAEYPEIDLRLQLYAQDPFLTDDVADAIVSARPAAPGFAGIHIIEEVLVAVHAASESRGRFRLITTDFEPAGFGQDWLDFCEQSGLRLEAIQDGPWLQCTHYLLALEMARAGLGVALVPDFLAQRDLDSGALQHLHPTRLPSSRSYSIFFKQARSTESSIRALGQWLKNQGRAETVEESGNNRSD